MYKTALRPYVCTTCGSSRRSELVSPMRLVFNGVCRMAAKACLRGDTRFRTGEELTMTKEDFIALADALRVHNRTADGPKGVYA